MANHNIRNARTFSAARSRESLPSARAELSPIAYEKVRAISRIIKVNPSSPNHNLACTSFAVCTLDVWLGCRHNSIETYTKPLLVDNNLACTSFAVCMLGVLSTAHDK